MQIWIIFNFIKIFLSLLYLNFKQLYEHFIEPLAVQLETLLLKNQKLKEELSKKQALIDDLRPQSTKANKSKYYRSVSIFFLSMNY